MIRNIKKSIVSLHCELFAAHIYSSLYTYDWASYRVALKHKTDTGAGIRLWRGHLVLLLRDMSQFFSVEMAENLFSQVRQILSLLPVGAIAIRDMTVKHNIKLYFVFSVSYFDLFCVVKILVKTTCDLIARYMQIGASRQWLDRFLADVSTIVMTAHSLAMPAKLKGILY